MKVITKNMVAIGLCLFLTLAPIIGSFIRADNALGIFLGHFTPYMHLTMSYVAGFPFLDGIGSLLGFAISLVGIIGFIILIATRSSNTDGLLFLLYITIIYCTLRFLGAGLYYLFEFDKYNGREHIQIIIALLSDLLWGVFCYWASSVLNVPKKQSKIL